MTSPTPTNPQWTHTPTPWTHEPLNGDESLMEIIGADGELVLGDGSMWGFNNLEDQEFAFHTVNCHDNMLAALRTALLYKADMGPEARKEIAAAIAKAQGHQP